MLKKPNFFIIGAPKCGTTSIANWLTEHPNVYMSPTKEPHFFDTDHKRRTYTLEDYEQLFQKASEDHITIGEASVFYLFSREAVPNILEYNDEAKFVVLLRNPFEMAYSLHRFYVYIGREDVVDFARAWGLDDKRREGHCLPAHAWDPKRMVYRDVCALGAQVERLLKYVPRERVHFAFTEDLRRDAQGEYEKLLEFLGLLNDGRRDFPSINVARRNRVQSLANFSAAMFNLKHRLGIKRGLGVLNTMKRLNRTAPAADRIDPELRREIVEFFHDDVAKLVTITNRDLSHWE